MGQSNAWSLALYAKQSLATHYEDLQYIKRDYTIIFTSLRPREKYVTHNCTTQKLIYGVCINAGSEDLMYNTCCYKI